MKKYIFIAVACLSIAACTKEASGGKDDPDVPGTSFTKGQKVTLTVSAGDQTKVTGELNGTSIDFKWQEGDVIKVTVGDSSPAEFTLKSGDGKSSATFEGTMPASGDTFDIQYPVTEPTINTQTYSSTEAIPRGMMLLNATGCTLSDGGSLKAQNAVLRLNLYGTNMTIGKIVTYLYTSDDGSDVAAYTLNCNGVKISSSDESPTPLFIVLPRDTTKMTIDVYDNASTKTIINSYTTTSLTFAAGSIIGTNTKELKKEPLFSVNAVKKVKFTKGNLWYGTEKLSGETVTQGWYLESSQVGYGKGEEDPKEGCIYYNSNHVSHFFWTNLTDYNSGTPSYMPYAGSYSCSSQSTDDKFWCGEDNKLTVDGQSGLYVLSKAEWTYLIQKRTNASNLCKYGVTVTDSGTSYKNCLIIAPDDYSGTALSEITDWSLSNVNSLGLVCLSVAGCRNTSSQIVSTGVGYYWSSTPQESTQGDAYTVNFDYNNVSLINEVRVRGRSIRLVY